MLTLQADGHDYSYDGDPAVPLLWVLRNKLAHWFIWLSHIDRCCIDS